MTNQEEKVKEGIEFLLSHFEGRQRLFPRIMSAFATNGRQFPVYNKEQIFQACKKADFVDCRINAYPILEEGLLQAPNLIFIDLDVPTKYEDNLKELNKNLDRTLKIIKQKLNGCEPTVIWSGNGYHIYIILDIRPLEMIEELKELSNESSKLFLRFIETTCTNKKHDFQHNPSFKSCMLRIPGTLNSKNNSEIRIIQKFDNNHISPISNKLYREFRLYLADIDIAAKNNTKRNVSVKSLHTSIQYEWIEKLLVAPIEDGRKYVLWKILCPYLVNIKKLEYEQAYRILKIWLEKCDNSRKLEFDPDIEINTKLTHVKHYNPISIKKLKYDNKNLYLIIR